MPTYEYKCTNDGSTFDIWQEVGSPAPPCPDCGAPTKKVFAPPRVIFKGSGFYVTDKRAESEGKSGGGKSSSTKSSDSDSSDKSSSDAPSSEAKSDAKTETKTDAPKTESKSD